MSAYEAMMFAREAHKGHERKYTGNPYTDHLAEVAGIVAAVGDIGENGMEEVMISVAWMHDVAEDTNFTINNIYDKFGAVIAEGVFQLSDFEVGNRASRKAASRERLSRAPYWIQTIKCADLISNTSSIVKHDPKFASVYLAEKRALLDVMTKADPRLLDLARKQAEA